MCAPHHASSRCGMSLLEIVFSIGLFTIVLTATLQSLTGMRHFVGSSSVQMGLTGEAQMILGELAEMFSSSAWFIAPRDGNNSETDLVALATSANYDRNTAIYYPFVYQQNETSLPGGAPFRDYLRNPVDRVGPATYAPELWAQLPPDHRLPSQEVTLLRVRSGPSLAVPERHAETAWINFSEQPARMDAFNDPSALPLVHSLGLRGHTGFVIDMPIDWETYPGANPWSTHPELGPDPRYMREFSVRVVPDARTATARLERVYRNGRTGTIEVDRVISDKVDRLVVDTYRTSADLNVNQVRITIYMSEFSHRSQTMQHHRASVTVALRSTVDPEYALNLETWLGEAGSF